MNFFGLARRSVFRKPVKSILLLLIVFAISTLLLAGVASKNASIGRCKCSCVDNGFCSGIWNCNTKEKPERYFIGNELGGRRKC